jgi:hypothetical protein
MIDFILKCASAEGWAFFWFCLFVAGLTGLLITGICWGIYRLLVRMDQDEQWRFEDRRGVHLADCIHCRRPHDNEGSMFCSESCAKLHYEIPTILPTVAENLSGASKPAPGEQPSNPANPTAAAVGDFTNTNHQDIRRPAGQASDYWPEKKRNL